MSRRLPDGAAAAPVLPAALIWAVSWGALQGAVEAAVHLCTWSLYAAVPLAAGFMARSVLYSILFFTASTVPLAAVMGRTTAGRRWIRAAGPGGPGALAAGLLAAETAALYGVVTWRVGFYINASWLSPALLGGIAAALLAAVALGVGVARVGRAALGRWPRAWMALWPLAGLALVAVPLSGGRAGGDHASRRVLLVTLDTTRADRSEVAGGPVATPAMASLARRGVWFDQAVAQAPITCPSHLSMLSSTSPVTHGVFANGTPIPGDLPLLQEVFTAAGVPTAGFVAGYPVTARFGFDRGFDVFDDDFGGRFGEHRLAVRRLADQVLYSRGAPRERNAARVMERARPWLRDHASDGFFCWIHLFDAHGPYAAPEPFLGSLAGPVPPPVDGPEMPPFWPAAMRAVADPSYWTLRYHEEIAYADDQLGGVLELLDDLGVLDETLVAVVADHGESLGEHDYYFDHGLYLYDATLRVPMVLAGPGVPAGRRVPCQVRGMDLAPTVLDLVDLDAPETMEGVSMRALWERGCPGGVRLSEAVTVEPPWVEDPGAELALRVDGDARYKMIRHNRAAAELYDLRADPGETADLGGSGGEIERWLAGELERMRGGLPAVAPTLSADVEAQLRALGYISDGPRDGDDDSSGGGTAAP